jgi:Rnl2 family RNA ligase
MFTGYSKIAESSSNWVVSNNRAFSRAKCAVTEKGHGACFCFVFTITSSGIRLQFAKRKELLQSDEYFFGYKQMVATTEEKVTEICKAVTKRIGGKIGVVRVYGELLGGGYPHDKVAANSSVSLVQSGIYYSPDLHFYGFDISVSQEGVIGETYLDYELSLKLFEMAGILHAKPLFIGTHVQCLEYAKKFLGSTTTIPKMLGLPEIAGNKAEGVIVRPLKETIVETPKGPQRALQKIKIEEFSEEKYNMVEKPVIASSSGEFDYYKHFLDNEIDRLLTHNRVVSAMSKVGAPDKMKLAELVLADLIYEFEGNDMWAELDDTQKAGVRASAKKGADQLVESWLLLLPATSSKK